MPFSVTFAYYSVPQIRPPFRDLSLSTKCVGGGGGYLRDTTVLRHIFVPNKTPFVKAMSFSVRSCVYTQSFFHKKSQRFWCFLVKMVFESYSYLIKTWTVLTPSLSCMLISAPFLIRHSVVCV